jgi:hypothetical protein
VTLQVEGHVRSAGTHRTQELEQRRRALAAAKDDHFVDRRMRVQQRRRRRFDRPRDARRRPTGTQALHERQRAHDVADGAEQHDHQALRHGRGTHGAP